MFNLAGRLHLAVVVPLAADRPSLFGLFHGDMPQTSNLIQFAQASVVIYFISTDIWAAASPLWNHQNDCSGWYGRWSVDVIQRCPGNSYDRLF